MYDSYLDLRGMAYQGFDAAVRNLYAAIANPKVEVKAEDDPFMDLMFMVYQVKYINEIVDAKLQVGTGLRDGAFALAKAHWANSGDDITSTVVEKARAPAITRKLKAEGRCEHAFLLAGTRRLEEHRLGDVGRGPRWRCDQVVPSYVPQGGGAAYQAGFIAVRLHHA